ncbi:unnamed protein product [Symbiodinium sp. CCMP2592]|nr:unnamed protein product [Symbiodinium sp. CCMP2592]
MLFGSWNFLKAARLVSSANSGASSVVEDPPGLAAQVARFMEEDLVSDNSEAVEDPPGLASQAVRFMEEGMGSANSGASSVVEDPPGLAAQVARFMEEDLVSDNSEAVEDPPGLASQAGCSLLCDGVKSYQRHAITSDAVLMEEGVACDSSRASSVGEDASDLTPQAASACCEEGLDSNRSEASSVGEDPPGLAPQAFQSLLHIPLRLRHSLAVDEDSSPDLETGLPEASGRLSPASPEMRLRRVNLPWRFWRGFLWFPQRYEETKARGCCAGRTPISGASLASSISSGSP